VKASGGEWGKAQPVFVCERAEIESARFTLTGPEGRHATTVRRLTVGERVDVTDGAGLLGRCEVVGVRPGELDLAVRARHAEPEPRCRVIVVQAILKGDRAELAVELMTEVGVDEIVPWAAERCVARWRPDREDKALRRWRSTAREAAKQSRRARFPVVTGQAQTAEVVKRVAGSAVALLLDPAAGRQLADAVLPAEGEIVLIVGPEGGLSDAESAELVGSGALAVRLGPLVLRGSTAGTVAAALVQSTCGRWNAQPARDL
jgi:16S rRNA (uracil1498-N3)-methyltransferase